jgi:hypothetical protein
VLYETRRKEDINIRKTGTKLKKPAVAKKAPAPTELVAKKPKMAAAAEEPVKKTKSGPSIETSQKNASLSRKPKQTAVEKPAKKLKSVPSVKDSSLKNSPVKTSLVKVSKAKASASKPNGEAAVKKAVKPTKAKAPVKISAPAPKGKKPVSGTAPAKEKPAPLKKKTGAPEAKAVRNSKPQNPAKVSAAQSKTKKPAAAGSTPRSKKEKIVQPVLETKPKLKKETGLPKAAGKKLKPLPKKVEIRVPAINQKPRRKLKAAENKAETVIPVTKPKSGKKTVAAEKVTRQKRILKKGAKKIEKIEIIVPPVTVKPLKKKIKPIGSAVVRGKTGRYDFEVFPLDADLKDGSAIYVISKRITDQRGRGHHKFVCIGQTESLLGEIRKHKKDKCIKHYKANVICLLREESETNRLRIETDLREAHTIACNQK